MMGVGKAAMLPTSRDTTHSKTLNYGIVNISASFCQSHKPKLCKSSTDPTKRELRQAHLGHLNQHSYECPVRIRSMADGTNNGLPTDMIQQISVSRNGPTLEPAVWRSWLGVGSEEMQKPITVMPIKSKSQPRQCRSKPSKR